MSILVQDWSRERSGQRLQAHFPNGPDAISLLLPRDKEHGHFWVHLKGGLSPVIPLLLGLARVEDGWDSIESMPLVVHPNPDEWYVTVKTWLEKQNSVRADLQRKTGVREWKNPRSVDTALVFAPTELVVPLKLMKRDHWIWSYTS